MQLKGSPLPTERGSSSPPAFGAQARGEQGGGSRAGKVDANGAEKSWCPAVGARRGEEPEEAAGRHGVRPFLKEREKDRDRGERGKEENAMNGEKPGRQAVKREATEVPGGKW